MAKSLDLMTGAEIQKAYDKASGASSKICRAFIDAGRGHERPTEIRKMSDPLALEHTGVNDRFFAVVAEMEARKRYHGRTQRIIRKQ